MGPTHLKRGKHHASAGQAVVESVFSIIITTVMFGMICAICVYLFFQANVFMAARHGARIAATGADNATVVSETQGFFNGTTNQTLAGGNITVTGPTGATIGQRNMSVAVTYTINSPVPIGAFLDSYGATGAADALDSFDTAATATMRLEE